MNTFSKPSWMIRVASVALALGTIAAGQQALAAPSVGAVEGTLSHGSLVTVAGSAFGTRPSAGGGQNWNGSPTMNYRFKDFEDGQLSSLGFYPQKGGSRWSPSATELGVQTASPPRNSTRYLRRTYQTGESGGLSTDVTVQPNLFYTTFKFRVAQNTQSGKFFRFYGDSPQNNVYLSTGCNNYQVRGYTECSGPNCAGKQVEWGTGPDLTPGQWHRVEILADPSQQQFRVDVNGVHIFTKTNWLNATLGLQGHTMDYPNMIDSSDRSASCPAVGANDFDDIFIDFSRARVEIGDASTWTATRKKEVQIPVSWADGRITVRVNSGEFAAGSTAYLYVVDSNGAVNERGLAVTIGAAGTAAPQPIAPPGFSVR